MNLKRKNFESQSTVGEVMIKNQVLCFVETECTLQCKTNRKSYVVYRTVPTTLSDLEGHYLFETFLISGNIACINYDIPCPS